MKFVQKEFTATLEEKKSKFIAFLMPYEDFDKTMQRLRREHPKAVHFVYAYRYLNEFEQIVENSSDDGEPRGTSGKPTLAVLSGAGIINSAAIIVRYFGGIIRAYGGSLNEVINIAEFFEYKKLENHLIACEYSSLGQLEYILNQNSIKIINKDFLNIIKITIQLTKDEFDTLKSLLPREIKIL